MQLIRLFLLILFLTHEYPKSQRMFIHEDIKSDIPALESQFGKNKFIHPKVRAASLVALSFYPELKNTQIDFTYRKIKTTMQCIPVPNSLLNKSVERSYSIYINNDIHFEGPLFDSLPFNAQIGIIGHELAHVIDYENSSNLQIALLGLKYSTGNFDGLYEKRIDSMTVDRGLGWQLFDWSEYAMVTGKNISNSYREFKRTHYLKPEEIQSLINIQNSGQNKIK